MIPLTINKDIDTCGKLILGNTNVSNTITFNIFLYNPSTTSYENISISGAIPSSSSISIDYLTDGIYKIDCTMSGQVDTSFIWIQDCAIQNCKLNYISNILKCRDTNCNPDCLGDSKTYYNAMVVFELSQLYETIMNEKFILPSYENGHIISADQILRYGNILNLFSRIQDYCKDCIEPCKTCN